MIKLKQVKALIAAVVVCAPVFASLMSYPELAAAASDDCSSSRSMVLPAEIDIPGDFRVWARVNTRTVEGSASMKLAIGDYCSSIPIDSNLNQWRWVKFPDNALLGKGAHNLSLHITAGETWLDKLILTLDNSCEPVGLGDNCVIEQIAAKITGVNPEDTVENKLMLFSEISGLGTAPSVGYFVDDNAVSAIQSSTASDEYCLAVNTAGSCSEYDVSSLSAGFHTVRLEVKDRGRSVALSRRFTVAAQEVEEPVIINEREGEEDVVVKDPVVAPTDPSDGSSGSANKAIADKKPVVTAKKQPTIPVLIVDSGAAPKTSLEGEVAVTVPSELIGDDASTVTFSIDGEDIGTVDASDPEIIIDTDRYENRAHEVNATVLSDNGETETVRIPVIVNNSPFSKLQAGLASVWFRVIVSLILISTAAAIIAIKLKKQMLNSRIRNTAIINPQPSVASLPQMLRGGASSGMAAMVLLGVTGVVLAAPQLYTSNGYSGNASLILNAESLNNDSAYEESVDGNGLDAVGYVRFYVAPVAAPTPNPVPVADPDIQVCRGATVVTVKTSERQGSDTDAPCPDPEPTPTPTPDPTPNPTPVIQNNLVDLIISDTWQNNGGSPPWGSHDAPANVGTSYDFYSTARGGFWNDDSYPVLQPWCWVYSPAGLRMSENFRLEMGTTRFWFYYKNSDTWKEVSFNNGWTEGTFGRIDGQAWVQTGGTKSLGNNIYDIKRDTSYSFHPWSNGRLPNDSSADAALQLVDMRLLDSSGNPVSDAKGYQAHCQWDGYQGYGGEGGRPASYIARAKYLSGNWQTFSSITVPFQNPQSNSFSYDYAAQEIKNAMDSHPLVSN